MKRIKYATSIDEDLVRKLKVLAITLGKNANDLLEEAIEDLLKKYEKSPETDK